jgi:hypothetical protein
VDNRGLTPVDVTDRQQDVVLPLFVDETDEIGSLFGTASDTGPTKRLSLNAPI